MVPGSSLEKTEGREEEKSGRKERRQYNGAEGGIQEVRVLAPESLHDIGACVVEKRGKRKREETSEYSSGGAETGTRQGGRVARVPNLRDASYGTDRKEIREKGLRGRIQKQIFPR